MILNSEKAVCSTSLTDVFSMFPSQKSFSLVLEALDYDNETSESGIASVVCVCVYVCMALYPCVGTGN